MWLFPVLLGLHGICCLSGNSSVKRSLKKTPKTEARGSKRRGNKSEWKLSQRNDNDSSQVSLTRLLRSQPSLRGFPRLVRDCHFFALVLSVISARLVKPKWQASGVLRCKFVNWNWMINSDELSLKFRLVCWLLCIVASAVRMRKKLGNSSNSFNIRHLHWSKRLTQLSQRVAWLI